MSTPKKTCPVCRERVTSYLADSHIRQCRFLAAERASTDHMTACPRCLNSVYSVTGTVCWKAIELGKESQRLLRKLSDTEKRAVEDILELEGK